MGKNFSILEELLIDAFASSDLLEKYQVRLRVLGKTSLLPQNVKIAVDRAEKLTRRHKKYFMPSSTTQICGADRPIQGNP